MGNSSGVVAAGHDLTAQAGEDILRAGGNAYDAILAAVLASCVTEPVLASPGGGGFLLAAPNDAAPLVYDFFVEMPRISKPESELDFQAVHADFGGALQEFHIGKGSIAVPGFMRGIFEIHKDLCTMPMRDIAAPAIGYAKKGVKVNSYQAYLFSVVRTIYCAGKECRKIFGSGKAEGELIQEGEILKNPALADFLETLSLEGPDLFYRGEAGQALLKDMEDGGTLSATDLKAYEVIRRKPLELSYRGIRIEMNPPPASGGLLIAFGLKLFEKLETGNIKPGSQEHLLALAGIMEKTTQARIEIEAKKTDDEKRACILDEKFLEKYVLNILGKQNAARGTTHISIIDKDRNLASMTVSNGEGCGYVIPGTGVVMNNMLGEEDLNPLGFFKGAPGERLSSMMTPSTLLWPDGRRAAAGSGGSNRIRTALLQLFINMIDFNMPIGEAVGALRMHFEKDRLDIEGDIGSGLEALRQAFPGHKVWNGYNMFFGGTHVAGIDQNGFDGAGDPRRNGVCRIL